MRWLTPLALGFIALAPAIANGDILLEETITGGAKGSTTLTLPAIAAGSAQTYVRGVATKANEDITVSGGGLTWTEQVEQCTINN